MLPNISWLSARGLSYGNISIIILPIIAQNIQPIFSLLNLHQQRFIYRIYPGKDTPANGQLPLQYLIADGIDMPMVQGKKIIFYTNQAKTIIASIFYLVYY